MRTIEVKENGSMWQLATLWGNESLPKDGCMLFWRVLFHSVVTIICCVLLGLFLGDLTASLVASAVTGGIIIGWAIGIIGLLSAMVLLLLTIATPYILLQEADEDSQNPIMKTIYNMKTIKMGWKERWCPMVVEKAEENT